MCDAARDAKDKELLKQLIVNLHDTANAMDEASCHIQKARDLFDTVPRLKEITYASEFDLFLKMCAAVGTIERGANALQSSIGMRRMRGEKNGARFLAIKPVEVEEGEGFDE